MRKMTVEEIEREVYGENPWEMDNAILCDSRLEAGLIATLVGGEIKRHKRDGEWYVVTSVEKADWINEMPDSEVRRLIGA